MSKSSLNSRGFSLLEVVVAVAVLSVGIVIVLQALSFCSRSAGAACDMASAAFFAGEKMQEFEFKEGQGLISQEPPEGGGTKDNKFFWNYTLTADTSLNLTRLNFGLEWQSSNKKENLELNTYLR